MEFLPKPIQDYAEAHTEPEPELLQALARETWVQSLYPRMLSGHLQGRLLAAFSRMLQPRRVLEVGTFTGYSALCLAEGLAPDGHILTLEADPETADVARRWFATAGLQDRITCITANAVTHLDTLTETYDLVFIDARKEEYLAYYEAILPRVRPGGVILTDNVLWSGQVVEKSATDPAAKSLQAFNIFVVQDPRVFNVLMPVRDGIQLIIKR
ncbi:MAG: O-methyltransferase [Bacteroidetes bacterium]|nr:O-methyltransferase [Bacteroidota bacterium]